MVTVAGGGLEAWAHARMRNASRLSLSFNSGAQAGTAAHACCR